MAKCYYCQNDIRKATQEWVEKPRPARKPKHRTPVKYHLACWDRKTVAGGRTKWNVENPLGGVR